MGNCINNAFIFILAEPEYYNLPDDYVLSNNTWGTIFYKTYDKMNFTAAQQQCASDGASLPLPKSGKLSNHNLYVW